MLRHHNVRVSILVLLHLTLLSCRKFVEIPPPANSITTEQVFADSADAAAAISGIYSKIEYSTSIVGTCGNGAETILCGLSSDELKKFLSQQEVDEFYFNSLHGLSEMTGVYWNKAYEIVYQTNACIEGLEASGNLTQDVKIHFTSEAKLLRSLFYFYLINLFGDVPYITETNWEKTSLIPRTKVIDIYQFIIDDLKYAQQNLRDDYSFSFGERTRVNKYCASALLSRVYMYMGKWSNAESEANSVIENSQYSLVPDLNSVFFTNSSEAILQWQLNTSFETNNCTAEALNILPASSSRAPSYYLSSQLLSAFEQNDNRKLKWIDSSEYENVIYKYPFKYKNGRQQRETDAPPTEYYTVLRLAEQYLIRAEARAHLSDLLGATEDVNVIRTRAGLPEIMPGTQEDVLNAIYQERRVELFAEFGHRWLDLKRTGLVNQVMSIVTPIKKPGSVWQEFQQWYPIPASQIALNPNLHQTAGY
jgi:starch-binding outer membrane protein, SusD/RagB family